MPTILALNSRAINFKKVSIISAAAVMLTCSSFAFAQKPPGMDKPEGSSWSLGLGVMSSQKAYKGMDRETAALPMISYENSYVKFSGPNVQLKLPELNISENQSLKFGIQANLMGSGGYDASDSTAFQGMADRKKSTMVGAKIEWKNSVADVNLDLMGDASSNSKGQRVNLSVDHKLMLSPNIILIPKVGVEWLDKNYVDYNYGVRANEATASRAAYIGKATMNSEISLSGIYRINKEQSLMLTVGTKSLGKGITNSPIVARTTENRVMLGYMYRF